MKTKLMYLGTAIAVIAVMVVFGKIDAENGTKRYMQHKEQLPETERPEEEFSTHLPIVSIDTNGEEILWLSQGGYLYDSSNHVVSNELFTGDESLLDISCTTSVVSGEGEWHGLQDEVDFTSTATIRVRGNSSRLFDKKSYLLKFVEKDGEEKNVSVIGMDKASEWVLHGPFLDRTLLRNYLCYNVAGQVMDYAPDVRYCELFLNGEYQGLYLMVEAISRDEGRIEMTKPERGSNVTSWIVRLDRAGKGDTPLNNFTTYTLQTGVSEVDLRYPGADTLTPERLAYVENDLSEIERAIYSTDRSDPAKGYQAYIDKEAFAQYFVLNEFFGNVDAGRFSTYYYKDVRGKVIPVVWDFNNGCDNYIDYIYDVEGFNMMESPWFGELLKDEAFVKEVIAQYRSMREGVLSDENLCTMIDDTVLYLGDAVDRNYEKYGYVFDLSETDGINYLQPVERNAESYEESIQQLKDWLTARGAWMDANIDSLQQYSHESKNVTEVIE